MAFIDATNLSRSFSRTYADECAVAFSAIDCILNGEQAIYASTELTTGQRAFSVLREIGGTRGADLKARLGEQGFVERILSPNVELAMAFARRLHQSLGGNQLVITPAPFTAPGWTQAEYLSFWETLIRTRVKAVYFNDGWEYSNGCTFEFAVALDAGLPTCEADGRMLGAETAMARIEAAIASLDGDRLQSDRLAENLNRMRELVRGRAPIRSR
jgi:hypothetical protein